MQRRLFSQPWQRAVALWGAPTMVATVQRGTITVNAGSASGTATITAVDLTRTVFRVLGYSDNNAAAVPDASSCRVVLTDSTTLTATRVTTGSGDTVTLSYEVIEFFPGVIKSVQRGTITVISATSATATITAVDTSRSFVDFCGCSNAVGLDTGFARITLTNSTTVTASRSNSGANPTIASYQVVEFY